MFISVISFSTPATGLRTSFSDAKKTETNVYNPFVALIVAKHTSITVVERKAEM